MDAEQRGAVPHRGNLPAPATALIGRTRELAEVVNLVHANRLTTLTGVGGVGKTRLALKVAAAVAPAFPDGVWFVELAPVADSASVPDVIATAMGIAPKAGVPLLQNIAEVVAGRRVLIVLDNCEHVIDAAADAAAAIIARPGPATMLATSREGLRVGGEQLMPVPPLDLEGGATSAAVALFVQRARAVRPDFALDDVVAADAVTQICHGLDGLALPIELAAARMVSMTPVDLEQRLLADGFRMLTGSSRQRSLHRSVGWSFDLLDEEERVILRHASVFAGGFDVDSMTAVVGAADPLDVLDHLDSLVRKSLVIAGEAAGRTRYRLLETIRQFAENELSAVGTLDEARDRHAAHFATEAATRWERWNGPGFRDAVDWASIELANLRAAFRWSVRRDDIATAAALATHGAMIGVPAELFEILGWVEEILDAATAADVCILPRVYAAAGYRCFTGYPEQAVTHAQAAVRLESDARYEPFEPGLASFIEALAQVYAGHLDRYVELTSRIATLDGDARAYGLPAFVDGLQATGRVDEALDLVDDAVAAARGRGNPFWIAYALWIRGSVYARVDPARALEAWREALVYVHEEGVHFFDGFITRDAASVGLAAADPDEALAMFDLAIDSFSRSGNVAQLLITLASVTLLFERVERPEVAAALYGAIARQPAGHRHVPDLPDAADRLNAMLTSERFDDLVATGAALDLTGAADYAREQIQLARGQLAARGTRPSAAGGLSRRQIEVLRLVAEGCTTREIGERLYISAKTADHHIQHIYTKIGVSTRPTAALWASEHGILD